jgi:hypothetical protein
LNWSSLTGSEYEKLLGQWMHIRSNAIKAFSSQWS